MREVHFDWRCVVCCMVALSPLQLEHLPGTENIYFDIDNTPGVKGCNNIKIHLKLQCNVLFLSVFGVKLSKMR